MLTPMGPSRRDQCALWIAGIRFCDQDREASEGAMAAPGVEKATWEREDTMRASYPFLFRDESTWFSHLIIK